MSGEDTDGTTPAAPLLAVLENPESGRRRLPWLLGLLDETDQGVRIGAAWAICRVARADPDLVEYLLGRLRDRLDGDAPLEVRFLFEYLAAAYPETAGRAIEDASGDGQKRVLTPSGSLARADYMQPSSGDHPVGRTRGIGSGDGDAAPGASGGVGRYGPAEGVPRESGDENDEDEDADGETGDGADDTDAGIVGPARDGWATSGELSVIKYESVFDRLTVLASRTRGRYADTYRTLGVTDGDELPLSLALFHRPEEDTDRYAADLAAALDRWADVDDHDAVVTLHDWGTDPRPWAAMEYTGLSLADRGRLEPDVATWNARQLGDAVARAHERGVVHGGIDPGNVVYYGTVIDEDEPQSPLATNVGLMDVVRRHFDPTTRLDPRYAAPEYFDRSFGSVDHATDIYGLGAVVYRLFTGQPPFDGDYETVRRDVLEADPPRPSDVADAPEAVDAVVQKAMATRKLARYESVTRLVAELRATEGDDAG